MGVSSYLGLLKDERVTVVEVAEAVGSPYLEDFEVGLDVSAHATALGKALLAAMTAPRAAHVPAARTSCARSRRAPTPRRTGSRPSSAPYAAGRPVTEHGEFREGVSCTASLVPRARRDDPAWAVVVAVADEDVPARVAVEVALAAADLAGSPSQASS